MLRCQAQHGQRHAGEGAAPGRGGVGPISARLLVLLVSPLPVVLQRQGELQAHGIAHGVHPLRVHHVELLGEVGLGRQ